MGKTTVTLLAALFAFSPCAHGQTIAPQWNWPVSSDFGPRLVPVYDFHEGVDFNPLQGDADFGTPIPNLEGGLIFTVADNPTFLEVRVQGRNTGHMWLYGHIFRKDVYSVPEYGSTTRRWELRKNARLVLPSDTNDERSQNVIIRWEGGYALSAITSIGGDSRWIVDDQGYCVQDAAQNCIEAKAIAEAGDLIAPMGDAATTNVHLHLGLNYPDDNPYLDLQHPPDSLPVATILQPADGHIMTADELADYGFKARVDSVGGLDLDKVSFWIYKNKDSAQAIHLGPAGLPTFGYGGRAGEGQNGLSYSSDEEATGVKPIADTNGDTLGHDKFIFRQNLTALNLPDGEHSFVVRLKDVNENEPDLVKVNFTLDQTAPFVYLPQNEDAINGIQNHAIALSEGGMSFYIDDDPESLCENAVGVCKAVSGISRVKLLDVYGSVIYADGPYAQPEIVADYEFDLDAGHYVLDVFDAAGNETRIPISVSKFNLEVSTAESHVDIDRNSGTFTGTIHIKASSSAGLAALGLVDSGYTSRYHRILSGEASLEADLPFGGNIADYYYNPTMLGVGFTDLAGRVVWEPFNLNFAQSMFNNEFFRGDSQPLTSDFTMPAVDLVEDYAPMLPGAIMSVYAPTKEEMDTLPRWWWEGRNGFYGLTSYPTCPGNGADCSTHVALPLVESGRQDAGKVQVVVRTWEKGDRSDIEEYTVADRDIYSEFGGGYSAGTCGTQVGYEGEQNANGFGTVCYEEHAATNATIALKRYVETSISVEKVNPTEAIYCASRPNPFEGICSSIFDSIPAVLTAGPKIYGFAVKMNSIKQAMGAMLSAGHNITAQLPDGILGEFGQDTVFTPGMLNFSYSSVKNYPGYHNLSGNLAFRLKTDATFDHAKLTIPYNATGLTSSQETGIKIYKITDDGKFIALGTTVDTVNKKVQSEEMDEFGRFIVAASRYIYPQTVAGSIYAGGKPELEFTAEGVSIEQSVFNANTPEGAVLLSSVAEKGLLIGNIYKLGPDDLTLETPGTLKMHFDIAAAEAAGVTSLSLYGAAIDGTGLHKLDGAIIDPAGQEIAVDIQHPAGIYVLIGSTISNNSDVTPPVVTVSYGEPKYVAAGKMYISTLTPVSISGMDFGSGGEPVSGMGNVYYLIDASPFMEPPLRYSGPLMLDEGVRTFYYSGSDLAGNMSAGYSVQVYVDGTAPNIALSAGGSPVANAGNAYITEGASVTVSAVDATSYGGASGVRDTFFLIDVNPDLCENPVFTGAAGTCENPRYAAPFTLSVGTHTVYYMAVDNLGNQTARKSASLTVVPANSGLDLIPPVVTLKINGQTLAGGTTANITSTDTITLAATDEGSGLAEISYSTDTVLSTTTAIAYIAPFTLTVGTHTVYYTAVDNVGNMAEIKSLFLTVSASTQTTLPISPSSGPIGVPFTITGSGFGTYSAGTTVVLVGGVAAPLTLWSTTTIKGTIPGTLPSGEQAVAILRGTSTIANAAPFTVTAPALYTLTPSSGPIGLPFTITGKSFGNYVANLTKVLMGGATMPLTLWTDTKIQGTIPGSLAAGDYDLVVERALNGGVVRSSSATYTLSNMQAFWLAPSSGPIGMSFTITGEGFGNYSSAYEHVLLGDTTAPLTLWTDTKIQGTVPGRMASGQYPVVVERRTSDGGQMLTSPMSFEVVTVDVASMTPVAGPIGMPFTIYGANFGNYVANNTRVLIGGTTAPLTLWTATKIQGTIPGALTAGEYPVVVERELNGSVVSSTAIAFVVSTPTAYNITPSSGAIGVPFTINGANFGNYSAALTGVLINGATVPLTLWTDTKIQGTIPGSLAAGQYPVIVARQASDGSVVLTDALTFEVAGISLSSIAPTAGPIGLPFTIYGGSFGNYVANYTKVLIGGATAPLTLWADTKIQGTIPGSLTAGDYELVVVRALNGGEVRTSTSAFTVTIPVLGTIDPSTAAVIAPFTITGANFGNYVANFTKVLINGTTAPLTLWTDTKIQGKLPFLLNGTYPVQVQRNLNGGLAETTSAYITVAEPVISSMTPTSGAVGTAFNLYGSSFGPYDASQTRVTIGGVPCALSLWTDTNIRGTVPTAISYGTYTVVAMRGQALSNDLEYTVPEAFRVSMARPVTMLDAEFKLGEVYVYPNPAKGGKVPVFHVEVGLADSVKIKVFSVSGQSVLEHAITGAPQVIGAKYAYEYAWEGHIASGVYYYTMEAERAGKKLRAKGRFAVVR